MIAVQIESGICGLRTLVRAFKIQSKTVGIAIHSDCKQVMALANLLQKLDISDILRNPINENPIYKKAGKCHLHASCPVPCGVIKACEAELGLALVKDVKIVFKTDSKIADDGM